MQFPIKWYYDRKEAMRAYGRARAIAGVNPSLWVNFPNGFEGPGRWRVATYETNLHGVLGAGERRGGTKKRRAERRERWNARSR